jgi:hypothetical protein
MWPAVRRGVGPGAAGTAVLDGGDWTGARATLCSDGALCVPLLPGSDFSQTLILKGISFVVWVLCEGFALICETAGCVRCACGNDAVSSVLLDEESHRRCLHSTVSQRRFTRLSPAPVHHGSPTQNRAYMLTRWLAAR